MQSFRTQREHTVFLLWKHRRRRELVLTMPSTHLCGKSVAIETETRRNLPVVVDHVLSYDLYSFKFVIECNLNIVLRISFIYVL